MTQPWRFSIDRGGTFTDIVAITPDGERLTAKLLSENPDHYDDAAVAGIRKLTGIAEGALPPLDVRIGTTIATNALLERKGEPTLLLITKGFSDALRIGYQERPDIFACRIVRPEPLYHQAVEVDERVTAEGEIRRPVDLTAARLALAAAHAAGIRSVAIVLLHGWRHDMHERLLADAAREAGFTQISVSHETAPSIRLIGRGDTTVADAYLSPVLGAYVARLRAALGEAVPLFMQSSGGLADGGHFRGKDAILSGPAGGIVGMARTAAAAGFDRVIGFDMGGTSTDVSHFAGDYERDSETMVAGSRIRAPMMRIHTVAAGGGSICGFSAGRFTVGPASAGAMPGPACYRRGGPLTVTDCNVMLGKVQPDHFPKLFGKDGDQALSHEAVAARFAELGEAMRAEGLEPHAPEVAAEGFVAIAVANMANAIKKISVQRGHDVTRYTLACFGGAGGQHACLVADALGMDRVMLHPLAGVLSAYGIGLAARSLVREATVAAPVDDALPAVLDPVLCRLEREAKDTMRSQGIIGNLSVRVTAHLRQGSSESLIELPLAPVEAMRAGFAKAHRRQFGFEAEGAPVLEMVRVEVSDTPSDRHTLARHSGESRNPGPNVSPDFGSGADLDPDFRRDDGLVGSAWTFMAGRWHHAPIYDRARIAAAVDGPALIVEPVSTIVVEPGWRAAKDRLDNLILTRIAPRASDSVGTEVDPVRLEIFSGLFMAIAEEMGAALQQSAASVNIRERLDFSCALFDADGSLIANAPHMPVHLGSMGDSVRAITTRRGGMMRPGDAFALNAPYDGGTHLPDVTVVMPVFVDDADGAPAFYVAARGHHADIGGISPGSMPPTSCDVREEGVLIDNLQIVAAGTFLEDEVRAVLASGEWPARDPDRNVADLKAQVAACARGAAELRRIAAEYGRDVVTAYMGHVQANAEAAVKRLLGRLSDGAFAYEMDDGAVVRVAVTIDGAAERARIDFTGTSPQRPNNFNAPKSITRAAVLYAVRVLVDEPIPMNDGCLRPIDIVVPEGSMLNPHYPAAVVAGNVETSQVVTDAIFGALGAMAGAQGTMNNFTFGNAAHQYYETIAGGAGAGPGFDGASVVQTHMTNSRLTDPEILEMRLPVLLEQFAIRDGSGGAGRWHGGDGAIRKVRFREAMTAGILANRRRVPPFGLDGGEAGSPGRAWIERADGRTEPLGSTASAQVAAGDAFVIETPGGGGYGR